MSPDVLTDGTWQPDKRGVLRWVDATPAAETVIAIALLIACPSCHAKVNQTCRSRTGHTRTPHACRLAPRLCECGTPLKARRRFCDPCRDRALQEAKNTWARINRARRAA